MLNMIKLYAFLLTILFTIGGLFAQNFNNIEEATAEHMTIEGSNVKMIPPTGYAQSENFMGFQNPEDAYSMIMLMEIPGPFDEVATGFNEEMLSQKGMTLVSKKKITINEMPGLFLMLDQAAGDLTYSKYLLIYGKEATTLINGVYLKEEKETGNLIKDAMLSTFIDDSISADPRAALKYDVDESVADLQIHAVVGNSMLLNRDGKIPTESKDKLTLIIDESFENPMVANKKVFCLNRLKETPDDFTFNAKKGINEIEYAGIEGFEIFGKHDVNVKEEMYQAVLFKENGGYYIVVGTYIRGNAETLNSIKKVMDTFVVK